MIYRENYKKYYYIYECQLFFELDTNETAFLKSFPHKIFSKALTAFSCCVIT